MFYLHSLSCNLFAADILTNALRSGEADDVVDIEMQADMLLILSCMCDGDMHRKVGLSWWLPLGGGGDSIYMNNNNKY